LEEVETAVGHLLERNAREALFHVVQDGLQNIQACSTMRTPMFSLQLRLFTLSFSWAFFVGECGIKLRAALALFFFCSRWRAMLLRDFCFLSASTLSCWADGVEIGVLGAKSPDATPATMGRAGSEARAKIVTKKTCLFAIQILDRKHELLKKQT
jgi:hypothetical protein